MSPGSNLGQRISGDWRWRWGIAAFLLSVQALLAFGSIRVDSRTFDETSHLISGITYWAANDFRLDPENPPLVNLWATLPLRFADLPALPFESREWTMGKRWEIFAQEWFAKCEPADRWLWPARTMMTLLLLALSLTVYCAAREAVGEGGALISLACVCFWPTLIAHGRLVASDVPLGLFATLAVWTAYRVFAKPGAARWLLAGAALSALLLTKFSAVLVLPAWVAGAALGYSRRRSRAWWGPALLGFSLAAVAYGAIWAAYGFRFSMFANDVPDLLTIADKSDARIALRVHWQQILNHMALDRGLVAVPLAVSLCESNRLLPEGYLYGFTNMYHAAQGREAYAFGMYSGSGWWWYFPAAFALKTPLGIVVLVLLGAGTIAVRRGAALRDGRLLAALGVFVVVYAAVAMRGRINIGERHFSPIYPVLAIVAGASIGLAARPFAAWVIVALLGWSAVSTVRSAGNFLPYFNEASRAFDRSSGIPSLIDSNYDWGQDLARLREYCRTRVDAAPIKLAYFGSANPDQWIQNERLLSFVPREPLAEIGPGTYVVSPTILCGAYQVQLRPGYWRDPQRAERLLQLARGEVGMSGQALRVAINEAKSTLALARLRGRRPDARVGTLLVYSLSALEVERLASLEGPYP